MDSPLVDSTVIPPQCHRRPLDFFGFPDSCAVVDFSHRNRVGGGNF